MESLVFREKRGWGSERSEGLGRKGRGAMGREQGEVEGIKGRDMREEGK
jgi:hypothetical protein